MCPRLGATAGTQSVTPCCVNSSTGHLPPPCAGSTRSLNVTALLQACPTTRVTPPFPPHPENATPETPTNFPGGWNKGQCGSSGDSQEDMPSLAGVGVQDLFCVQFSHMCSLESSWPLCRGLQTSLVGNRPLPSFNSFCGNLYPLPTMLAGLCPRKSNLRLSIREMGRS